MPRDRPTGPCAALPKPVRGCTDYACSYAYCVAIPRRCCPMTHIYVSPLFEHRPWVAPDLKSALLPTASQPPRGDTSSMQAKTLSPEQLRAIDAWWRAANYLSVGQIFLFDNPLLKRPL